MIQKNTAPPSLKEIIDNKLCTGCATCVGVCPKKNLVMKRNLDGTSIPQSINNCSECNLCRDVCPVINSDQKEINKFFFDKIPTDKFIGNFIHCYQGYCLDENIRWKSSSGGVITSLLALLLKKKLITAALLTRPSQDNPLLSEPFMARTENDILSAMGSRYTPLPLNQLIRTILYEEGKFAVVALPCHMQGIRRAELKIPRLREKISYHLGITCSHTLNLKGVEFILQKKRIPRSQISSLSYRGEGWPGGLKIILKNKQNKYISNQNSLWSEIFGGYFFAPFYCTTCPDHLNELADISFADAWIPEILKNDQTGTSIIITRTPLGENLITEAISSKTIKTSELKPLDVINSQLWPLSFKKINLSSRLKILKIFQKKIPSDLLKNFSTIPDSALANYAVSVLTYLNIVLANNRLLKLVLRIIPLKFLKFYRRIFKRLLIQNINETLKKNDYF